MSITSTILGMSKRIPWSVGSLILYSMGLPRGRGWEKTIEAYEEPTKRASKAADDLENALTEHALAGEKLVRLYDLEPTEIAALREALKTHVSEVPLELSQLILDTNSDVASAAPLLVGVVVVPGGIAAVYSSIRTMPEREALSMDETIGETRDDVESVFAMVNVPYRAFDVVFLPAWGTRAELRMDFPISAPQESIALAVNQVEVAFAEDVGFEALSSPTNLFPLIDKMYQDTAEGIVVELHFNTTAGSTHSARTRRRSANLRTDPYHNAGVKGLTAPIQPFSVTIRWQLPVDAKRNALPELTLHSGSAEREKANPFLGTFVVRRCSSISDFDHVRDRIHHHLDAEQSDAA